MPISVTGPDNITVSFPDGTDASVINDVMTKHFGGGASKSSPVTADKLARAAAEGVPVVGGLLNKANAATYAGLAPLFPGDTTVSHAPSFGERYSENLKRENEKSQQFETEHPVASTAAGLAGGVAATLPLAATGAGSTLLGLGGRTLTGQVARGAASGAGINAADALVRGNDVGTAALVGGGLGGATPAVARGIGAAVAPAVSTVRGIINPAGEAAQRVGAALARDQAASVGGRLAPLSDTEFQAARAVNAPVNVMDTGGELTRAVARSAANTSPEGRAILNRAVDDRFEGQSGRLIDWLNSSFNYPSAVDRQAALENVARTVNQSAYGQAMRDGAGGLWSPELERLAGSDAVSGAMRKAASAAKDEGIVSGYGAMNPNITFTQDGRIQFARGPSGVPTYPDLQFWDLTRRQLSDAATQAEMRGQATEARRLGVFAQGLNTELDRLVPSYATARAGAARAFGAQDALQAGQQFVTSKMGNREAQLALMRMNPQERQLFQDGFASRLVEQLREVPNRRNVLNTIANSPAAQQRIELALGPQRARELEGMLRVEGVMDLARGAIQGNSTTARQLMELGLAGGAGSFLSSGSPFGDPTTAINSALVYGALRHGGGRLLANVDERVSRQVAQLLTSNDPNQVRMGMRTLGSNSRLLGALRNFDTAFARSAATQIDERNR